MLLGVYRSPSNSLYAFNTLFPAILNLLRFNSYVQGDFNVDVCGNYLIPSVCDFKDIFECEGYNSIIDITTRISQNSQICIHHIHVKCNLFCESGVFKVFLNLIYDSYNKNCQVRCKCVSTKKKLCPWISDGLARCIDEKQMLYRLSILSSVFHNGYVLYTITLKKIIITVTYKYLSNNFNNSGNDPKATRKILNVLMKPNKF